MSAGVLVEAPVEAALPLRRFSRAEFYWLAEQGLFRGQKVELIEGNLMVQSPQNWPHANAIVRVQDVAYRYFRSRMMVRVQLPLWLDDGEPEPDLALVPEPQTPATEHPRAAALVLEVSDSSLQFDRVVKGRLYASSGIAEYWIVNVAERLLEVYREPGPGGYGGVQSYGVGASVATLFAPEVLIPVAELFGN
ncbi:MAG: Uma2 family endonuclease [Gemmataceae bacterium]